MLCSSEMPTRAMIKLASEELLLAIMEGSAEGVLAALDAGAALDDHETTYMETGPPLMLAIGTHQEDMAKLLVEAGADVNKMHQLNKMHHITPLMAAASSNCPRIVTLLLKAGADVKCNSRGQKYSFEIRSEQWLLRVREDFD